ncbi:AL8A1-like protein [Mya arenaria]|uniref:AL8A1-like protein n=1 Tax=Mya arenaria TaxID=6604 RepID=A0ABY7FWZ3_MYAAR|nr:AL8A1-like protein [Mya arenaria]
MSEIKVQNFIDGKFVGTEKYLDSFDPSTGEVWAKIPDSGQTDVDTAVKVAKSAFEKLDEFAELESRDQGKPVWLAKSVDIPRAVYNLRFFATCALHDLNSPWNLPLYLLTFKLAPAMITGNTVVAKPSEMTSVTAWKLAEVFNHAGLPAGVVNFVFGTGPNAGDAIVKHPDVPVVSFTGGTLGGKNPGIIFDDADLEKCIPTTIRSSFMNQGEICLCTSRLYVQRGIYQTFLDRFVAEAKKLVVGDPKSPDTFTGALISKEHLAKVIERANAVKYGLAATVWSTNVNTLHTVSQKLHESGTGRESAKDSIEFFTEEKTICVKLN